MARVPQCQRVLSRHPTNGSNGAITDSVVIPGLKALVEDVYLVDLVTSPGIIFNRQELLKA